MWGWWPKRQGLWKECKVTKKCVLGGIWNSIIKRNGWDRYVNKDGRVWVFRTLCTQDWNTVMRDVWKVWCGRKDVLWDVSVNSFVILWIYDGGDVRQSEAEMDNFMFCSFLLRFSTAWWSVSTESRALQIQYFCTSTYRAEWVREWLPCWPLTTLSSLPLTASPLSVMQHCVVQSVWNQIWKITNVWYITSFSDYYLICIFQLINQLFDYLYWYIRVPKLSNIFSVSSVKMLVFMCKTAGKAHHGHDGPCGSSKLNCLSGAQRLDTKPHIQGRLTGGNTGGRLLSLLQVPSLLCPDNHSPAHRVFHAAAQMLLWTSGIATNGVGNQGLHQVILHQWGK